MAREQHIQLTVNGRPYEKTVPVRLSLADFLLEAQRTFTHPALQRLIHLLQLLKETVEDATLDDRLALLGIRRHKIEGIAVPFLPDAVDAAETLLQACGVPRHVVVDHQMAELEVDPFARCFVRHADLGRGPKVILCSLSLVGVHAAMNLTGVIITKLDGSAKGGVVAAICEETGLPIRFVGLGEGDDDLEPFDPKAFAEAILGG